MPFINISLSFTLSVKAAFKRCLISELSATLPFSHGNSPPSVLKKPFVDEVHEFPVVYAVKHILSKFQTFFFLFEHFL